MLPPAAHKNAFCIPFHWHEAGTVVCFTPLALTGRNLRRFFLKQSRQRVFICAVAALVVGRKVTAAAAERATNSANIFILANIFFSANISRGNVHRK